MRLNPFASLQPATLTIDALREAVLQLQAAKIETASLDARVLLEHALGVSRERLLLIMDEPMTDAQLSSYQSLVTRRLARQPVAQLIGKREFWGMEFKVTKDTLDPRPDSETLIESLLAQVADHQAPLSVLDLGTGTGCLLLSLLSEMPHAKGVAVDCSEAALAVAQENALALGLSARVQFVHSCWHERVEGVFDIIISNPPYIPQDDIAGLAPEVAQHEPMQALSGGKDGLDAYRAIIPALPNLLSEHGIAAFEIGYGQRAALEQLVANGPLEIMAVKCDLQGTPRCIIVKRKP